MTKEETDEYIKFMNDPSNIGKCEKCPENIGANHDQTWRLPCGQYRCWVWCHCQIEGD